MGESKQILLSFLLIKAAVIGLCLCKGNPSTNLDLYDHLLHPSRYNPAIIPRCKGTEKLTVRVGMALRDIVQINEKQQFIRLKIWVRMKWKDCMLQWDPPQFQNQTELVVPYEKIWIPDITLYEGISDEGNMPDMDDYRASMTHAGDLTYNFPCIVTVVCQFSVAYFPFDHQVCSMKFGSWIYTGKNVDLERMKNEVDISSFRNHNEWDVVDTVAVRHNIYYGCCTDPYPDITFHIHIRRKPLFYVITIIFPCFLINILTLMGFVLPPFAPEKISLQITVLLSTTVFLLLVQDKFPSASENFPLLALYFAICMVLVCVSCVLSSIVLHVYNRSPEEYPISTFTRSIFFDRFRKIMCMKSDMVLNDDKLVQIKGIHCLETGQSLPREKCVEIHKGRKSYKGAKLCSNKSEIPEYPSESKNQSHSNKDKGHITNEWELFAYVLDRFFLLIYLCLALANTAVFVSIMVNYDGKDIPMD